MTQAPGDYDLQNPQKKLNPLFVLFFPAENIHRSKKAECFCSEIQLFAACLFCFSNCGLNFMPDTLFKRTRSLQNMKALSRPW